MSLNTYTFTQLTTWVESTQVEANSEEEALELINSGDCDWDLVDYVDTLDGTLELTDVEFGCPLTQMVVNEDARRKWEAEQAAKTIDKCVA